jgi:uncharacterized phage infection (PIP) family protein YhgE
LFILIGGFIGALLTICLIVLVVILVLGETSEETSIEELKDSVDNIADSVNTLNNIADSVNALIKHQNDILNRIDNSADELNTPLSNTNDQRNIYTLLEKQNQMINNFHKKMIWLNTNNEKSDNIRTARKNDLKEWLTSIGKDARTISSYIKQISRIEEEENEKGNYIDIWSASKTTIEELESSHKGLSLYLEFLNDTQN